MSIVTGIQTGINAGIKTGINGLWGPKFFSLTSQAAWSAYTGITLSSLYLCTDASAQLTDAIGAEDLAESGTPIYGVTAPWGSRLAVSFTDNSSDAFQGDTSTFADDGATSFLFVGVSVLGSALNRHVLGRYVAANNQFGLSIAPSTGRMRWRTGDGTNDSTLEITVDHRGIKTPWACGIDRTANKAWVATNQGRAEADITGYGTISNGSASFAVGSFAGGAFAMAQTLGVVGYGTGATTELSAAEQTALIADLEVGL